MPAWMRTYLPQLGSHGEEPEGAESAMSMFVEGMPNSRIATEIALLERLHAAGLLKVPTEAPVERDEQALPVTPDGNLPLPNDVRAYLGDGHAFLVPDEHGGYHLLSAQHYARHLNEEGSETVSGPYRLQMDDAEGIVRILDAHSQIAQTRARGVAKLIVGALNSLDGMRDLPPQPDELPALFLCDVPGLPAPIGVGVNVFYVWQEPHVIGPGSTGAPPGAIMVTFPGTNIARPARTLPGAKWYKINIPPGAR